MAQLVESWTKELWMRRKARNGATEGVGVWLGKERYGVCLRGKRDLDPVMTLLFVV